MASRPGDFNLPANIVNKILTDSLPDGVTVSTDAKSALGKAASIFVLYSTSCAQQLARTENRDNLTPQDVLAATTSMGFQEFGPDLKATYQQNKKDKDKANQRRREKRKQQRQNKNQDLEEVMVEEDSGHEEQEDE